MEYALPVMHQITCVMLKVDIETTWLKKLYDKIWKEENKPREWAKGKLVTIPKKGDLTKCITLLSTQSKILGNTLMRRIKETVEMKIRK